MENELTITTEQIDDFVLLLEVMKQMGLPEILDRHLPRHWLEEGMRWGWADHFTVAQGVARAMGVTPEPGDRAPVQGDVSFSGSMTTYPYY